MCTKTTFFTLQDDEFSKYIDVDRHNLFKGSQVFVLWNWIWIEDSCSPTPEGDSNPKDYLLPPGQTPPQSQMKTVQSLRSHT